jgi:hypothetical protein
MKAEINKMLSEAIRRVKRREKTLIYSKMSNLENDQKTFNKGITAAIRTLVQLQKEFNKKDNEKI